MITKEYLQQELRRRIDSIKIGFGITTKELREEMESILVLVDALQDRVKDYDDALEKARMYRDNAKAVKEYSAATRYENIFPELRESEDEKARKELISYLNAVIKEVGDLGHPQIDRWIAYLEKQKEQKLAWNEEDETIIEGACSALEIHGHDKLASKLKSLRPSWKPSKEQMDALYFASYGGELSANECIYLTSLYKQLKKL